jgi:hypothetical protein
MPTQEQITEFLQKLLMIVGGFAAGYLGTWLACVGFDKTVVKGKSPDGLHKWARRIGGALVALVVAFFIFRGGTGGGGGGGPDSGPGTGQPTSPNAQSTDPTPATEKLPEVAVDAVPVYVTVYAGAAVERGTEKFFAVGDPPGAKVDRAAVAEAVRAGGKDKAKVFVVYTLDDTATTATTAYLLLQAEAKAQGVPLVSKADFDKLRRK